MNSPYFAKLLSSELVVSHDQIPASAPISASEAGVQKSSPQTGTKRLRTRWAIRKHCEEEFDTTMNSETSCRYHTLDAEPDLGVFSKKAPDTPVRRRENSRSYSYECCGRDLLREGCEEGWHIAYELGVEKRRKFYAEGDISD